jgi:hypothetical protein
MRSRSTYNITRSLARDAVSKQGELDVLLQSTLGVGYDGTSKPISEPTLSFSANPLTYGSITYTFSLFNCTVYTKGFIIHSPCFLPSGIDEFSYAVFGPVLILVRVY